MTGEAPRERVLLRGTLPHSSAPEPRRQPRTPPGTARRAPGGRSRRPAPVRSCGLAPRLERPGHLDVVSPTPGAPAGGRGLRRRALRNATSRRRRSRRNLSVLLSCATLPVTARAHAAPTEPFPPVNWSRQSPVAPTRHKAARSTCRRLSTPPANGPPSWCSIGAGSRCARRVFSKPPPKPTVGSS